MMFCDLAYFNADPNAPEYDERNGIGFAAQGSLEASMQQADTSGSISIAISAAAPLNRYGAC